MGTAVLEIQREASPPPSDVGALGAFLQPSPTVEEKLVRSDERLLRELVGVLDRQLLAAIDARSVSEFCSVRKNVMPRYVRGLRALQDTAINLVSLELVDSLSSVIFLELVETLEKQGVPRFGPKLAEQAVFTLWTVGRIRSLMQEIVRAGDAPSDKRATDRLLLSEYRADSLWAQFHLDMLFAAVRYDRPVCEQIRDTICDGLRAAVNAYVIMKDALALRSTQSSESETAARNLPWDQEDEQLLASSMRDRNAADPSGER
jgi:hypothetical protein